MHWIQSIFLNMDIDRGVVHDLVKENVPRDKEGKIMTIAEQWKQEGEMKGRVEGRVEGEAIGRQAIIQRLVNKRFGQNILDFHTQEQLRKATPEQLDLWAERILDAKSVDEVFKDN